mmetsp:Transcript_45467/g.84214  ORF Transcript_45467/g.84214 Transcript_45467/m.84214 type:complete len:290 (-) Transcript_45467:1673-2542(-)
MPHDAHPPLLGTLHVALVVTPYPIPHGHEVKVSLVEHVPAPRRQVQQLFRQLVIIPPLLGGVIHAGTQPEVFLPVRYQKVLQLRKVLPLRLSTDEYGAVAGAGEGRVVVDVSRAESAAGVGSRGGTVRGEGGVLASSSCVALVAGFGGSSSLGPSSWLRRRRRVRLRRLSFVAGRSRHTSWSSSLRSPRGSRRRPPSSSLPVEYHPRPSCVVRRRWRAGAPFSMLGRWTSAPGGSRRRTRRRRSAAVRRISGRILRGGILVRRVVGTRGRRRRSGWCTGRTAVPAAASL